MKKKIRKLQLNRETLTSLAMAKGGVKAADGGTHYRSLCQDLCEPTDPETVLTD
ncbi:MAG: class I lanthipeptide [Thermoanaerobaculia bacterium]